MRIKEQSKKVKRDRRHLRTKIRVMGDRDQLRLVVFRSLNHIYAQVIDDKNCKTIIAVNDSNLKDIKDNDFHKDELKGKCLAAYQVGRLIAEKALEKKINTIAYDRGGYQYHGRVKALADGAREGGLKF